MGTWTHPALRGSGEPAYRNNAVEQTAHPDDARYLQDFRLAPFSARTFPDCEPLQSTLATLLAVLRGYLIETARHRGSRQCSEERIHSVNQILQGHLDGLLNPCNLAVVRIFEFLNAAFEFGKPSAYVFQLPIVFELHVHSLPGKPIFQKTHARSQILNFSNRPFQIRLFQLHGSCPLATRHPRPPQAVGRS